MGICAISLTLKFRMLRINFKQSPPCTTVHHGEISKTVYCALDTGVNTPWRREWSESCPHVCSLRWAALRCISTTPRAGGSMWTGCASSMAVMTALHYTTNNRAPRHPVSSTSKWNIWNLSVCRIVSTVSWEMGNRFTLFVYVQPPFYVVLCLAT